jgi:hypothetical protein
MSTRTYEVVTSGKLNPVSIARLTASTSRVWKVDAALVGTPIEQTKIARATRGVAEPESELITIDAIPADTGIERFTRL